MAQEHNNMEKRRKRREQMQKARAEEQKRLKKGMLFVFIVLALCAVAVLCVARDMGVFEQVREEAEVQETFPQIHPSGPPPETTEPPLNPHDPRNKPVTTIHLRAGGDLNITDDVVSSGKIGQKYDYTRAFIDVQALLSDADLTLLNYEGSVCGEPYGTETKSAPSELLDGLVKAGVDMLQTANSYSIYNGLIGMTATLNSIQNAGLISVGAYPTAAEAERARGYTIVDVRGVKIAFVAFTKGVGGMGMPAGNEDCVNLLYEDYDTTSEAEYQKDPEGPPGSSL